MKSKRIFRILAIVLLIAVLYFTFQYYQGYKKKIEWETYVAGLVHTASPNVQILKDTIVVDYLNQKRTLGIYLPPSYHDDSLDYPVIYFLDGQSLFDEKILEGEEWEVDEIMDSLAIIGAPQAIIVGVYNTEYRMTEYKPFLSPHLPEEKKVTGDQHAEWIATDLKDWVDDHYRTIDSTGSTFVGGASLGGLMAYYMLTTFSDVYGGAIIFSPSLWVNDNVYELHHQVDDWPGKSVYLNAGELETPIVKGAESIYKIMNESGIQSSNLQFDIEPNEGHGHMTWRKGIKKALPWILENTAR